MSRVHSGIPVKDKNIVFCIKKKEGQEPLLFAGVVFVEDDHEFTHGGFVIVDMLIHPSDTPYQTGYLLDGGSIFWDWHEAKKKYLELIGG